MHPDGSAVGSVAKPGASALEWESSTFAAALALSPQGPMAIAAPFVYSESHIVTDSPMGATAAESSQAGTANVELVKSLGDDASLAVKISFATVPDVFGTKSFTRVPLSEALQGLSFSRLGGFYNDWGFIPPTGMAVQVDSATGNLAGQYAADCQVSGRVHGYDPATGMFKLEATLQGTGCIANGNGSFVGQLASSRFGRISLQAMGIMAGKPVMLDFTHSQQLGTY